MDLKIEENNVKYSKFNNNLLTKNIIYDFLYNHNNSICDSFLIINTSFILDLYGLSKHITKLKISKDKKLKLINNLFEIITFVNNELFTFYKNIIDNKNIDYIKNVRDIINKIQQVFFEQNNNGLSFYIEYLNDISKLTNYSMKDIKEIYEEIFNVIKIIVLKNKNLK